MHEDKLKLVYRDAVSEEDLAEEFMFFIEENLELNDHEDFLESLNRLPKLFLNLYLPFAANTIIESHGIAGLFGHFSGSEMVGKIPYSFCLISMKEAASIVEELIEEKEKNPEEQNFDELEKRYFSCNQLVMVCLGKALKVHKGDVFMAAKTWRETPGGGQTTNSCKSE